MKELSVATSVLAKCILTLFFGVVVVGASGTEADRPRVATLLEKAQSLYDALEYADVIPLAVEILGRADASVGERLDAYFLHGCSLAIVGDPIEAEKPFRFLLRGRPDFDMSPETAPKILAVFRKVQVEERAIAQQMRELERRRLVSELVLTPHGPDRPVGGHPIPFGYTLRDPRSAVQGLSLHYRRKSQPAFASVPLQLDGTGKWGAEIPAEWSASPSDYTLEYYVTTFDAEGEPLISHADQSEPARMIVLAGEVPVVVPIYRRPWFWAGIAGGVAVIGGLVYLAIQDARSLPDADMGPLSAE